MARTAVFGSVMRALGASGSFGPRALSRRHFLALSAALAACTQVAPPKGAGDSTAIIGGGAAGLTVAYRLGKAGKRAIVFEATDRFGGRMFTKRDFNEDKQFCELGGELVDTNHIVLKSLAAELEVPIQSLEAPVNDLEEIYHIGGKLYSQTDMLNSRNGRGAFAKLADRIAADRATLLKDDDWTDAARALDQKSLADYLKSLDNYAPDWAMKLLDIAYWSEMGVPTSQQSALGLIDFIGIERDQPFRLYGESDEAFRIQGGSSTLTDALATKMTAERKLRHVLTAIARTETGVKLSFDTPEGKIESEHARVVLALPFSVLRTVAGIDQIGLSPEKLKTIRELGYGDNAKLMVSTKSRPWTEKKDFPAKPIGVFFSDGFQEVWDTSRGQTGERGILTNFMAGQQDRDIATRQLGEGLTHLSMDMGYAVDPTKIAWMAWSRMPFNRGSYSAALVGQYTTLFEHTASPSEDGRIHFAGEHTSADFGGFMNGAIDSAERCATELLKA
jgi:monoamine oxidase